MAGGRRKTKARREPVVERAPAARSEVRVNPRDRVGAAPAAEPVRQAPRKREQNGGGRKRPALRGRPVYWGLVLGLWLVIGAIGAVVWVGAHLPPIQSLEVPKR